MLLSNSTIKLLIVLFRWRSTGPSGRHLPRAIWRKSIAVCTVREQTGGSRASISASGIERSSQAAHDRTFASAGKGSGTIRMDRTGGGMDRARVSSQRRLHAGAVLSLLRYGSQACASLCQGIGGAASGGGERKPCVLRWWGFTDRLDRAGQIGQGFTDRNQPLFALHGLFSHVPQTRQGSANQRLWGTS